jgi:hypothetical protein
VRAVVGGAHASFRYTDAAARVVLRSLTVSSLAIDGRMGVATLRGRCVQVRGRRVVGVTIVLKSHAAHRSLRIRLSTGYVKSSALLKGAITFMQGRGSAAGVTHGGSLTASLAGNRGLTDWQRGLLAW